MFKEILIDGAKIAVAIWAVSFVVVAAWHNFPAVIGG